MTFESTPASYSSVNSDLVYVVYDAHAADPVTYPNYKYVGEVFIAGTKVFTAKVFPNPDNNRGIFNFGSIIREYITATLAPTSAGILAQVFGLNDWKIGVVVKIREEYGGTLGAVVLTDSERFYANFYAGRTDENPLNHDNEPASNRPRTVQLRITDENYFIPFYVNTGLATYDVEVNNGTSTYTKTITPTGNNLLHQLNIAPAAINSESAGFIASTSTGYTVTINDYVYNVEVVCNGFYGNYHLHFMNRFGGFDTMLFNKAKRITNEVERKTWQQSAYRVSASGVVSYKAGDFMHPQKQVFGSKYTEKLKVSTDLLTDAEYQWLAELVRSPYVLLEENGVIYPVVITDSSYEFKEKIIDRFTNLSVMLEAGTTYKTQYQ